MCNKIFTEELNINTSKGNISNKVKNTNKKGLAKLQSIFKIHC